MDHSWAKEVKRAKHASRMGDPWGSGASHVGWTEEKQHWKQTQNRGRAALQPKRKKKAESEGEYGEKDMGNIEKRSPGSKLGEREKIRTARKISKSHKMLPS